MLRTLDVEYIADKVMQGDYSAYDALNNLNSQQLEELDIDCIVNEDNRSNKEIINWLIDIRETYNQHVVDELRGRYFNRFNLYEKTRLCDNEKYSYEQLTTVQHKYRDRDNNINMSALPSMSEIHKDKSTPIMISEPALARGTTGSAGHDLPSGEEKVIPANGTVSVDTGVVIYVPNGYHAEVKARSGLRFKHKVTAFNGVIDSDYRGTIKVNLVNESDTDFEVKKGDRIAQLVIYKNYQFDNSFILDQSGNHAGFGSTGMH